MFCLLREGAGARDELRLTALRARGSTACTGLQDTEGTRRGSPAARTEGRRAAGGARYLPGRLWVSPDSAAIITPTLSPTAGDGRAFWHSWEKNSPFLQGPSRLEPLLCPFVPCRTSREKGSKFYSLTKPPLATSSKRSQPCSWKRPALVCYRRLHLPPALYLKKPSTQPAAPHQAWERCAAFWHCPAVVSLVNS